MNIPSPVRHLIGWPVLQMRMKTLRDFILATKNPEYTQDAKLQAILRQIAGSGFARAHGLKPDMTASAFRQALPVDGYDRMQPWIDRVAAGESDALFSDQVRLMMFAMTSGTTGSCKYIPVTESSFAEYRRSWTVWGCGVARDWPRIPYGGVLNFASAPFAQSLPGGLQAGSISGMLFRAMHYTMRFTHSVPPAVADVTDSERRIYLALRLAMMRQDTRMLTTANPSTLISVARRLHSWQEDLLRDLRDGTLRHSADYPAPVIAAVSRALKVPRPDLVKEIEMRSRDGLTPRTVWPVLELLGVWTGGMLAAYLPEVRRLYGEDIGLRDHGLSASEARMTIPFQDHTPSGVLNTDGGYFEFIPVKDYEQGRRATLRPWDLEEGADYYIILSTTGGLIRYDISDVVRCTGYFNRTPCLAFLNKGSQIGNLTGEKLSAWQATSAVNDWFSSTGNPPCEYTVLPRFSANPGYVILLEQKDLAAIGPASPFLNHLDQTWRRLNMEYADKRQSGRLAPPQLHPVADGFFTNLKSDRLQAGGTFEQYKHPFFSTDQQILQRAGLAGRPEEQCS